MTRGADGTASAAQGDFVASCALQFEDYERGMARAGSPAWVALLRRSAIERFAAAGLPTTREERWRTTSVAPIAQGTFHAANGGADRSASAAAIERAALRTSAGALLVFVDGRLDARASSIPPLPDGVRITSLAAALESDRPLIEPVLARLARPGEHPFVALNTAFLGDGAFVHVPEGVILEEPVRLLFLTTEAGLMTHPRTLVLAGPSSQVTIVESYASAFEGAAEPQAVSPARTAADGAGSPPPGGGRPYLTNAVTEIVAEEGAIVEHDKVQQEADGAFHVAVLEGRLARQSVLRSTSISLGSALSRNEINVVLGAEGAECSLNGLFLGAGAQHLDHHTTIDHAAPEGTSRELYKGILDGSARGVFEGRILVRPNARKTDARQVNRNLVLSEEALIDTTPQLEILNDDVKCSHAATIGRLDEDALFYLRSRAIDESAARVLLMKAFAGDVLAGIGLSGLRRGLDDKVSGWLSRAGRSREAA